MRNIESERLALATSFQLLALLAKKWEQREWDTFISRQSQPPLVLSYPLLGK